MYEVIKKKEKGRWLCEYNPESWPKNEKIALLYDDCKNEETVLRGMARALAYIETYNATPEEYDKLVENQERLKHKDWRGNFRRIQDKIKVIPSL